MDTQILPHNNLAKQEIQSPGCQYNPDTVSVRPISFNLYMIFLVSYFLHLPARIKILGLIRFDLILMAIISFFIFNDKISRREATDEISRKLYYLFIYIVITLPLVRWPGSVIKINIFLFLKAIVFFFFTIHTIRSEKDLKTFMKVFILCQCFRVLEPVWLHITTGYWGSAAHIQWGQWQPRLAGAPSDIINPNGLAWVIVSILPFMFFLTKHKSSGIKLLFYASFIIFLYALQLTQSRSGIIGFAIVIGGLIWKNKYKIIWIVLTVIIVFILFDRLDPLSQDRYLSIYRSDVKGSDSAQERYDRLGSGFRAVFNKPIVGHGLGTSVEVGANVIKGERAVIVHNLYIEVLQELGLIGLIIFMYYFKSVINSFLIVRKRIYQISHNSNTFLMQMVHAMQVWAVLSVVFSMASYGLNKPGFYFFGGISVVLLRLSDANEK